MNHKSFTDIFIRRPVFSTVISLIILLIGLQSYRSLNVRQFPEIETSVITISTTYRGASAKLMEGFVSTPIENALSSLEGLDYMVSENTQGSSEVSLYLKEGYPVDVAMPDASNKVESIRHKLPDEIDNPVIAKQDPNSRPTLFIAFPSNILKPEAITDFLIRVIKPEVEGIDGVGEARIFGERAYAMRIWLNPWLMAAHRITPNEIVEVLRANNVQSAAGRIDSKMVEINITAKTDLNTAEQFNNLVLKEENNRLIRIGDIGYAELGPKSDRSSTRLNGEPTVVMGIIPKSTANPLIISKEVRKILPRIRQQLPADMKANVVWDSSKFISESIFEVYKTIIEACIFVILVIYLFLGSIRAVLIPAVTIPLSLFGVCPLLLSLSFSINTITLLACVLAIGMVVDDAIVVLENIHRHLEEGLSPLEAAMKGAREIRFAIISMTLTLAAVYAPIGFISGLTGTLFREFAFALAGSVIVSGVIALTLSPMLCSKVLRLDNRENSYAHKVDAVSERLRERYRQFLRHYIFPNYRWVIVGAVLVLFACFVLWAKTPKELAPTEDQGAIMGLVTGPTTANLAYTEKYTKEIEQIYNTVPERENYVMINGRGNVSDAMSFLILKPWSERKVSAGQVRNYLFPLMWSVPGVNAFPIELPSLPGSGGNNPIEFVIKTTQDYPALNDAMQKLLNAARQNPKILNADVSLKLNKPEIRLSLDRDKAGDMNISMGQIGTALSSLLAEPEVTQFEMRGRSYDVIPQLFAKYRALPQQLNDIYLKTRSGQIVPLSNIAEIKTRVSPQSLMHFQQLRAATLTASMAPGYTLGEALTYLSDFATQQLPKTFQYDFSGQSRQFITATGALAQIFLFALIFIYLVLAAQFESFRDPLIVMTTVPLSIAGALVTMRLSGSTMNIYTQIGLVTLIGLITKHGILMVEFANQLQLQGKKIEDAIIEAAATRLRPILMTTATMILGATPLALATGAGAASRQQIGWVIVGGMAFGTMLTLFVVPVIYKLFTAEKQEIIITSSEG